MPRMGRREPTQWVAEQFDAADIVLLLKIFGPTDKNTGQKGRLLYSGEVDTSFLARPLNDDYKTETIALPLLETTREPFYPCDYSATLHCIRLDTLQSCVLMDSKGVETVMHPPRSRSRFFHIENLVGTSWGLDIRLLGFETDYSQVKIIFYEVDNTMSDLMTLFPWEFRFSAFPRGHSPLWVLYNCAENVWGPVA